MTIAQGCITEGSISGAYLSVCLGQFKGWECTKWHLDDLFSPQMLEFNSPEAGLVT